MCGKVVGIAPVKSLMSLKPRYCSAMGKDDGSFRVKGKKGSEADTLSWPRSQTRLDCRCASWCQASRSCCSGAMPKAEGGEEILGSVLGPL